MCGWHVCVRTMCRCRRHVRMTCRWRARVDDMWTTCVCGWHADDICSGRCARDAGCSTAWNSATQARGKKPSWTALHKADWLTCYSFKNFEYACCNFCNFCQIGTKIILSEWSWNIWVEWASKTKTLHQEIEWVRNIKIKQLEIVHCILAQISILKRDAVCQLWYIDK